MKIIVSMLTAAALTAALITPVKAKETNTSETTAADFCPTYGELAEVIMQSRQAGMLMSKVLATSNHDELITELAIEAYQHPIYSTEEYRDKTVAEFKADQEAACYTDALKK